MVENLMYKDILKDISFSLKEGTINALVGMNGSGKTLLFKSLFGLVAVEGLINVNGMIVTKESIQDIRKNFGIYLDFNTLENKTVFLNIIEPLINLDYDECIAKKKVYEISKKLGIENLLYKEIETLSHSQKKMVSFAQCVIHDPNIILIDGLLDGLDTYYKNKVVDYLKKYKKNRKAIIIFTTNNSEDLLLAENLLILKNGKILVNGLVKKLIQDENIFLKNRIKLPFIADLSYKLKAYNLINRFILSTNYLK